MEGEINTGTAQTEDEMNRGSTQKVGDLDRDNFDRLSAYLYYQLWVRETQQPTITATA